MVSPSKLQHQPQHQSTNHLYQNKRIKIAQATATSKTPAAASNAPPSNRLKIFKGPKPLDKKIFYLDVKNQALSTKFENKIKEFGGVIELFLVKNVTVVVTDRPDRPRQGTSSKWGYNSGGSGGPPSLRSIDVQTPTPTPPTPYRSVEGPLSNSTNQRGSTTQRPKSRTEAMLERALTQPQQCSVDPLSNAYNWGIPIWSTYELQTWLEKISANLLKESNNLKRDIRTGIGKEVKVKRFKQPFIKFESYCRKTRPIFVELQSWPTLNFNGEPGSCPYDLKKREKKENVVVNKDIEENKEKYFNPNTSKGKDMTRRPRATATRARKTENTGYCEICRADYRNLSKHLQSDQHKNFIRDDKNFLSLDNLINTGASVETFLKINRQKDGKGSILSSRDHGLDNGIRSSNEKKEKREKCNVVNDFDIDDIKMVQCNGARRNLNSKLDNTSHNLRTRVSKNESGHSLRSKGKADVEREKRGEKSDKSSERFTITKRAKGTLWIEEEDSEDDSEKEHVDFNGRPLGDPLCNPEIKKRLDSRDCSSENISMNGDVDSRSSCRRREIANKSALKESFLDSNMKTRINGYEKRDRRFNELHGAENKTKEIKIKQEIIDTHDNGEYYNEDSNSLKSLGRRSTKPMRGHKRLSVEERLIEDNRDYYKVEVLGSKLRSSAIPPSCNLFISSSREHNDRSPKKEDKLSSDKTIGMRFKRVRKSELSLLSDEAETFMFGENRRDDSSSESDGEQSSVLPRDTESDGDADSQTLESSPTKREVNEDEHSQDSTASTRCGRKRRRTHTEVLLKDNSDYYKFEIPGSRLRYQAPLTGISDLPTQSQESDVEQVAQKIYPSKPSPEVEGLHYSFEAVPKSESWYQTYQRQDEGEEFYYYSEVDRKPFLLPYEIENFHEILQKSIQNSSIHRKRGRKGGVRVNPGSPKSRSPRKSPRCHASTLAIMSTIIRRREQPSNLVPIEEEPAPKSKSAPVDTAKTDKKSHSHDKSDVDEDLKEIVKNIDEMLSCDDDDMDDLDSFEVDLIKNGGDDIVEPKSEPAGPPNDLLDLLNNCHDIPENSSCASSDCGENSEFPTKRRKKKRKNKTGWPGNKMRRKLHIKNLSEELQRELEKAQEKKLEDSVSVSNAEADVEMAEEDSSHAPTKDQEEVETENETGKENEQVLLNKIVCRKKRGRRTKSKESKELRNAESADETTESKNASIKSVCISKFSKVEEDERDDETRDDGKNDARRTDCKETLSSISEDSEASLSNNDNFCTQEAVTPNSAVEKSSPAKFGRKRKNTTSSEASQSTEAESSSQRHRNSSFGSSPVKRLKEEVGAGDGRELHLRASAPPNNSNGSSGSGLKKGQKRSSSSKLQPSHNSSSRIQTPPSSCSKSSSQESGSFSVTSGVEKRRLKKVRRNFSVSSELPNGDIDAVRASPPCVASSDVDQRRSSIDFQPVVRVMKIEDQVDIDTSSGGVISAAVASNRILRSSSSPRSSMQPPRKRCCKSQFQRKRPWLKNS